jgi:hypothetical protein
MRSTFLTRHCPATQRRFATLTLAKHHHGFNAAGTRDRMPSQVRRGQISIGLCGEQMNWREYIEQNSRILGGKPVFKGTRSSVAQFPERFAAGDGPGWS